MEENDWREHRLLVLTAIEDLKDSVKSVEASSRDTANKMDKLYSQFELYQKTQEQKEEQKNIELKGKWGVITAIISAITAAVVSLFTGA